MQDNEKKPALRFKGFTDPWEQRKLDELGTIVTGSTPSTTNDAYYADDGLLWVTPTDITKSITCESARKLSASGQKVARVVPRNTILVTCIASIGKNTMLANAGSFNQQINGLTPDENKYVPYFLLTESVLWSAKMKVLAATGTLQIINRTEFSEIKTFLPSFDEQKRISQYFEKLDTLITLHQRKYEKLVNIKKSMLDKMFPKNGASVPEIRFKGFTDLWEQRKLGDAFERVVRKNTNNESRLPLTISAQDGLVDQITYFNNRVASRDVSNYYLVYNGEFAYNKSTSDGYPFGAVKRLDWYEKGVLSTLYIVFALKHPEKDDSDFMTVFYDTDRWHRGVAERAAEGARNHGLLNISADDFFDIDTTMPEDKAEQEKIGRLLKKLDTLITLHQRKLEKLQNIKKSCLEKMFV